MDCCCPPISDADAAKRRDEGDPQLLHGVLQVTVFEARVFRGAVTKLLGLSSESWRMYATVDVERQRVARTRIVEAEAKVRRCKPVWEESFHVYCAHDARAVVVSVKDARRVGASLLGRARIPSALLLQHQQQDPQQQQQKGAAVEGWFPLYNDAGRRLLRSRVRIQMSFLSASSSELSSWAVPRTYFPQRKGCRVTLYNDACSSSSSSSREEQQRGCWADMYEAISGAEHIVYIAGWSVDTRIQLVRGGRKGSGVSLGELLKRKASEGVQVLLLVWDDRTSMAELKKSGIMGTRDQETLDYFQGTQVRCVLCPRNPDQASSALQSLQTGSLFTHHQKSVVVDAPRTLKEGPRALNRGPPGRRKLVAFLGGLDLCGGRFDDPSHPLFATQAHSDDFYQPNFEGGASWARGGPREPWHDIHCRLEGAVCRDVLRNFEQRWGKQGDGTRLQEALVDEDEGGDERENAWAVQLFRSIDDSSVVGFPESPRAAAAAGLTSSKNRVMERSVQDAYIHAIRAARRFIYVESQYFVGSCFAWGSDRDVEASNLVPREIALKVASKIRAGERFVAYIVLPMWPEGVPSSPQVQAILDWQWKTIAMMYGEVWRAIAEQQRQQRQQQQPHLSPKDYLTFFCLGNREALTPDYSPPDMPPELGTHYRRAQDGRMFMIYVHSKMMIVDDEYVIVGSANVNQRSMDGGRDTEICMGAHQLGARRAGGVQSFRMALWAEHLGRKLMMDSATAASPSSLRCVRGMNDAAEQLWRAFTAAPLADLGGHLLPYPLHVSPSDGSISDLRGYSTFPDTSAPVRGAKSAVLPAILTT